MPERQKGFLAATESPGSGGGDDRPVLDGAAGKILGQLVMPFSGLGSDSAMSGGPLFCGSAHVKTLVRLHPTTPPNRRSAGSHPARKK